MSDGPEISAKEITDTNEIPLGNEDISNQRASKRTTQCSGVFISPINNIHDRSSGGYRYRLLMSKGLSLAAEEVSVIGVGTLFERLRRTEKKVFVQNVSAYFDAVKLHAIASPDASNSLEMLEILSGARAPTLGVVTSNGIPVQTTLFRQNIGWVQFDKQTFTKLSNWKNTHIYLRRRRRCGKTEVLERIESVLKFVGLERSKKSESNTKLENLFLHIALELVWDPPVLFVINPLQGLHTDEYLMISSLLSRISLELRKTVIISTETLPLMLCEKLDTLTVVGTNGHIFYSGSMSNVYEYYNSLNLSARYTSLMNKALMGSINLPGMGGETTRIKSLCVLEGRSNSDERHHFGENREDNNDIITSTFSSPSPELKLMQLVSQEEDGNLDSSSCIDSLSIDDGDTILDLASLWSYSSVSSIHYSSAFNDSELHKLQTKRITSKVQRESGNMQSSPRIMSSFVPSRLKPGIVVRTLATLHGDIEQTIRRAEIYVGLLSVVLLLLFAAWALSRQDSDQIGMQSIRGIVFFMFFMVVEMNNMLYIDTLERDTRAFLQLQKSGVMSPIVYIFIFAAKAILSRGILVTLLSIFASYMLPVDMRVSLISGMVAIFSISHLFLTYLVVLLFMSIRFARYVSYALTCYFIFLSGFLINLKSIPTFLGRTSLIRYGYGAVIHDFLSGKPYSCDNSGLIVNASIYCYTGDQYLELQGLEHDTKLIAVEVLGIASVMLLLLCWVRLRFMG